MNKTEEFPGVILLGDHIQALALARSLGQNRVPVYLLNENSLSIVRFSKYISKFIKAPSTKDESNFVSFALDLAEGYKLKDYLLIPTNDNAVKVLSNNKTALEKYYRVPTPNWEITKFALDKKLTYDLAKNNEILVPKTYFIKDISKIEELNIQYPVLIKGVEGLNFYKKTGVKAFQAESNRELEKILKDISPLAKSAELIIQEKIPGNTDSMYSFCSFFKNGEAIGVWTGRKIREHPMGFGTATLAESIYIPEIIQLGSKILKAINYYGISEIEFKKDPRDGKFKLIEINARSWLWVSLARRAGVDFATILYNDIYGKEIARNQNFEENIKWIHLYTDSWISIKEISKSRMSIEDYFKSLKGEKEYAVFSLDDPLPFIAETLLLPYLFMTR
jgi:predicted ATP-grasp superfamily ATP-dependent carboligase